MDKKLDHFELLEKLAEGGFGEVWKARRRDIDTVPFSLKIFKNTRDSSQLKREIEALFALNHPGIVRVFDAQLEKPPFYLVMEYCPGKTLREILKEERVLEVDRACQLGDQLLEVLTYLHDEKIIHGDVKPENILVDEENRIKIIDFGLAQWYDPEMLKVSLGETLEQAKGGGTLYYMAPEVTEKAEPVPQSDVFSAGVVLYEMRTGFAYPLYQDLDPEWYEDLVYGALSRKIEDRFDNARIMWNRLRESWGGRPVQRHVNGSSFSPSTEENIEASMAENGLVLARQALDRGDWSRAEQIARGLVSFDPSHQEALEILHRVRIFRGENWNRAGQISTQPGHKVQSLAFSPHDRWLAASTYRSAGGETFSRIFVYQLENREVHHIFSGRGFPVRDLAFEGEEKLLVGASFKLLAWNVEEKKRSSLKAPWEKVTALAFSSHYEWLALGTVEGVVEIWNFTEGKKAYALDEHTGPIGALFFSPSSDYLASRGRDGRVKIWDLRPRETVPSLHTLEGNFEAGEDLWLGEEMLLAPPEKWSLKEDQPQKEWEIEERGLLQKVSPGGNLMAVLLLSGKIEIWDIRGQKKVQTLGPVPRDLRVTSLAFNQREDGLALGMENGMIWLWEVGE